jgi:hypothetical protein
MPPKSDAASVSPADDRRAVSPEHLKALIQMQRYPTAYVQRLVEHLSFLPTGGQHWQRDVQLRLPVDPVLDPEGEVIPIGIAPTMHPEAKQLFIVSLGMFTRSRFADFTVHDAAGNRLPLLTRMQHGFCLVTCFLLKYLSEEQLDQVNQGRPSFDGLYEALLHLFTTVDGAEGSEPVPTEEATALLLGLLVELEDDETEIERKQVRFEAEYTALQSVTQYLCWAVAEPGEPITLTATYTMADAPQFAIAAQGSEMSKDGIPGKQGFKAWWTQKWRTFAIKRTGFYSSIGLGPLNYELLTPAHDHAGSYYFVIRPPDNCRVSYLDWGLDNSIDNPEGEVDCAFNSVHIHNAATLAAEPPPEPAPRSSIAGSVISAFLRADFKEHWPLLIAASLTILLAILAERGEFVSRGGGVSSVLLIAPTALLAYIAQRQTHHYAQATRWMEPLLIAYLLANICFIASVKYDVLGGDTILGRANALDDLISAGMLIASLGLILWFVAIHRRDRVISRYFRRGSGAPDAVDRYTRLGLRYGDATLATLAIALFAVIIVASFTNGLGWGKGRAHAVKVETRERATHEAAERAAIEESDEQKAESAPAPNGGRESGRQGSHPESSLKRTNLHRHGRSS